MSKPIKSILFSSIVLAAAATTLYLLNMLDQVIHGQLYNYGLLFDLAWANPYWTLLRIVQILLGVIAAVTSLDVVLTVRKYVTVKKQTVKMVPGQKHVMSSPAQARPIPPLVRTVPSTTHPVEKVTSMPTTPTAPPAILSVTPSVRVSQAPPAAPSAAPSPTEPLSSEISGLIRCNHCGKAFTQPLRMLDFQGDRPRIVSICPFCNEIINTAPRQEEKEKDKRFSFRKKNNDHTPKALASQ